MDNGPLYGRSEHFRANQPRRIHSASFFAAGMTFAKDVEAVNQYAAVR